MAPFCSAQLAFDFSPPLFLSNFSLQPAHRISKGQPVPHTSLSLSISSLSKMSPDASSSSLTSAPAPSSSSTPPPFDAAQLAAANATLSDATPQEILAWAVDNLPNLYQTTAFGLTGLAATDMLAKLTRRRKAASHLVPLIFIDTLYHFKETLALASKVEKKYKVVLSVYRPPEVETTEEFEEKYGKELWKTDEDTYDYLVKVSALLSYISSSPRRRSRPPQRSNLRRASRRIGPGVRSSLPTGLCANLVLSRYLFRSNPLVAPTPSSTYRQSSPVAVAHKEPTEQRSNPSKSTRPAWSRSTLCADGASPKSRTTSTWPASPTMRCSTRATSRSAIGTRPRFPLRARMSVEVDGLATEPRPSAGCTRTTLRCELGCLARRTREIRLSRAAARS